MAEGLARRMGGATHAYYSAGTEPSVLNPLSLRAMQEVGIDITHSTPKRLSAVPLTEIDCVVVLSDAIAFESSPNSKQFFWPQPDPETVNGTEQERMDAFRKVRDGLVPRIRSLFL